ncbi:MAG: hypothetical protein IPP74_09880 [Alphaproteobacteria bacterium]|nr:hypothetical protein [Alphaproteobacteria bacterium]
MKKIMVVPVLGLVSVSLMVSACQREISSGAYSSNHIGEASDTFEGTVISVRQIQVKEADKLQDNGAGLATGAVAGGVGGAMFGKGRGSLGAAAAGAILGGLTGAYAQQQLSKQQGMEYIVKLTNGQVMTVVQGLDNPLVVGDKAFVIVSNDGRSRVVRDTTGVPQTVQPVQPPKTTKIIKVKPQN